LCLLTSDFRLHLWGIVLLLVLLAVTCVFSAAEAAVFSLSPGTLHRMRGKGKSARLVGALLTRPQRLLNVLLLGNLLASTAYSAVSAFIVISFRDAGRGPVALAIAALVPLLALILVGEVMPKLIGFVLREKFATLLAAPLALLDKLLSPVVNVLSAVLISPLSAILAPRRGVRTDISADELGAVLDLSARRGVIGHDANMLLQEILELTGLHAGDVMVPRVDVVAYDLDGSREGLEELFRKSRLRKIPVFRNGIDNILGVIHAKRLFLSPDAKPADLVVKVPFVPEAANLERVLIQFRVTRTQMAIVVDEFGGTAGLITLREILEEIVGDLPEAREPEAGPAVQKVSEREYLIDGDLAFHEFADAFDVDLSGKRITTLGGFVTSMLGRIARVDDVVQYRNLRFTVLSMRRRRVGKMRLELTDEREDAETRRRPDAEKQKKEDGEMGRGGAGEIGQSTRLLCLGFLPMLLPGAMPAVASLLGSASPCLRVFASIFLSAPAWEWLAWSALALVFAAGLAFANGMETGAYVLNKLRLDLRAESGQASAKLLRRTLGDQSLLIVLLASAIVCEYGLTFAVSTMFVMAGFGPSAQWWALLVAGLVMFVFCESVPKSVFRRGAERLVYRSVWVLAGLDAVLRATGVIYLIHGLVWLLMRVLAIPTSARGLLGHEAFASIVAEGHASGVLTHAQAVMADRILHISNIRLRDTMIPMSKVVCVAAGVERADLIAILGRHNFSRVPVVDSAHQVVGVLDLYDVLLEETDKERGRWGEGENADAETRRHGDAESSRPDISRLMQRPLVLSGETTVTDAIYHIQQSRSQMAIVADATGKHVGIVTIKDLVEEIVGELDAW
jgi:putative hemolysin